MRTVNEDRVELSIANDVREIAGVAARIDEFCDARGIGPHIANAVNVSIDELITNTIDYGYDDDGPHRIGIALRRKANALVIEIEDDGREFDPSGPPPVVEFEVSLEDRAVGGLGLFLMHELMDSVDYRRAEGRNFVTLTKSLVEAD